MVLGDGSYITEILNLLQVGNLMKKLLWPFAIHHITGNNSRSLLCIIV